MKKIALSILFLSFFFGCNTVIKKDKITLEIPPYEWIESWPKMPKDFVMGNATGLGITSNQNIVVFHRCSREWKEPMHTNKIIENTISVFDSKTGSLLNSWGSGLFIMPHGLEIDRDDNIWVTDVGLHQVFKFSLEGKLLMTLGEAQVAGNDSNHFDLPTDIAVAPDGSFYVSDGYGNSRVIQFNSEGEFLLEWGTYGNGDGEFNIPHGIDLDASGNVYVADRENNRIQKFDALGNYIKQWQNSTTDQLYSVVVDQKENKIFGIDYYIKDGIIKGSDIFRLNLDLNLELQWGRSGYYNGPKTRFHDIAVAPDGSLYTGDILNNTIQKFSIKK